MAKIKTEWLEKQKLGEDGQPEKDPYVAAIVKIGEKVVDLMEALSEDQPIDANALILEADRFYDEGITGNMAAYIALIATICHSRGEEFKRSWNKHNGDENRKGVINPAILTVKV